MPLGDIVQVLSTKNFPVYNNQPATLRKRNKNYVLLCAPLPDLEKAAIRSIYINDSGIINDSHTDFLSFGPTSGRDMGLIHWHGNIFAVISNDQTGAQHLWTVSCDSTGVIPDSTEDYLEVWAASNYNLRTNLLKIHNTILVIGQPKAITPNMVQTVQISGAGHMGDEHADGMDLPEQPRTQRLRHGPGNIIVELFRDDSVTHVVTYTCTGTGLLPAEVDDDWIIPVLTGDHMALCQVSETVYAIFIQQADLTGQIHTFSINPNGTINKSYLDSEKIETELVGYLEMIEMGQGYFLLGYRFSSTILRIKTYYISETGTIQDGHIGTGDISINNALNPSFEHLNGDIWTIIYSSPDTTLNLDTFEIVTPIAGVPHHEMIMGMGP